MMNLYSFHVLHFDTSVELVMIFLPSLPGTVHRLMHFAFLCVPVSLVGINNTWFRVSLALAYY